MRKIWSDFGVCEIISEMMRMSEELTKRSTDAFDNLDLWRLIQVTENNIVALSKVQLSKLDRKEKEIAGKSL